MRAILVVLFESTIVYLNSQPRDYGEQLSEGEVLTALRYNFLLNLYHFILSKVLYHIIIWSPPYNESIELVVSTFFSLSYETIEFCYRNYLSSCIVPLFQSLYIKYLS